MGLPTGPLQLAGSYANEVWLGPDFVLRLNVRGDPGRLLREAQLARRPGLSRSERHSATRQLAEALRALHAVQGPGLPQDPELDPPHVLPLERLLEQLQQIQLDPGLRRALQQRAISLWPAFDPSGRGLVHGDLHYGNVLWHEGQVTALLDLEWARESWLEVDLEILLAASADPAGFLAEGTPRDWGEAQALWEEHYPDLFAHPRRAERLLLLAISRQLGFLVDEPHTLPDRLALLHELVQ
jgi:aminoglycoside phosphotransferase (APT) family kinase protein